MAKWTEYTKKEALKDNDELMILDTDGKANKRTLMNKVWDYVVDKMTSAVIAKLDTTNKTIIGALNEVNSKPLKGNYISSKMIENLESDFQKSPAYSLFSGSTMSGSECGYYGYKHDDAKTASVIAFSRDHTVICIRDVANKRWEQYLLK